MAVLGVFGAAPAAQAAQWTVDDDRGDCPAAQFTSVQAAIDAAAAGDTIAICPGTYREGTGDVASNALTITKSLTLKGAGADLVSIRPTMSGTGQIAEANQDIRNGVGDVVSVRGGAALPITVDISGVTVDGAGVVAEAGVVYLDAQGTIYRSKITNVITSELAADSGKPGGYRGPQFGYGIAQVTANTSSPQGATTRTLTISQTRVERYNRVGVLIDGATNDLAPYSASGVVNRGVLSNNAIVGRLVCTNFTVDGNCSASGSPGNNLTTTGPLFGQDGVRATAGASVALTGNTISQNLVHGVGAPTRGSATNNANLRLGAGVRLVGAAASTASRNNILDNAYGAINVELDGTTPNTATPFAAENNWWGLRSTAVTPPNAGPAISPTTNPPFPENPVNGAGVPDGTGTTSNTVDFFPYRNGSQADPDSGQFVVFDAPRPVDDAAPTVSLSSDRAQAYRGETLTLTANAGDDFGVKRVSFYSGGMLIGVAQVPPFTIGVHHPLRRHLRRPAHVHGGRRGLGGPDRLGVHRRGRQVLLRHGLRSGQRNAGAHARRAGLVRTVRPGRRRHLHREHDGQRAVDGRRCGAVGGRSQHGGPRPPRQRQLLAAAGAARAGDQRVQPDHAVRGRLGQPADAADLRRTDLQ